MISDNKNIKIDFEPVKDEILLENNFIALISSLEFYISLQLPKEVNNISALKIVKKLKGNNFDFYLDDVAIMIEALNNFEAYILGKFKVTPDEPELRDKKYLASINTLVKLFSSLLNSNGFDCRSKKCFT